MVRWVGFFVVQVQVLGCFVGQDQVVQDWGREELGYYQAHAVGPGFGVGVLQLCVLPGSVVHLMRRAGLVGIEVVLQVNGVGSVGPLHRWKENNAEKFLKWAEYCRL